jgi:hypothetical protein
MAIDFDLVISAENNDYMAWQTQVCCYSALTRLHIKPIVVVHQTADALLPAFKALRRRGCDVIEAPSFIRTPTGKVAQPRNAIGTLHTVATAKLGCHAHMLLCEADFIFVNRPSYAPGVVADEYNYVDYADPHVVKVLERFGIAHRCDELNATSRIGVPYLIPRQAALSLAQRWFEVYDAFEPLEWIDMMPAFGIAAALEGLSITTSHQVATNHRPASDVGRAAFIHYCYGDDTWSKRHYLATGNPMTDPGVSAMTPTGQSVADEIFRHIQATRGYFAFLGHVRHRLTHRGGSRAG